MINPHSDSAGCGLTFGRSVSLEHAAKLLGVSRRTIYNRIKDGRLQTVRTLGGSQRVIVESLTSFGFGSRRSATASQRLPAQAPATTTDHY